MSQTRNDLPASTLVRPCQYRARARWGDQLLAESTRALRVDAPGETPTLWFPWDDVRTELLRPGGQEAWDGGELERFDAQRKVPATDDGGRASEWTANPGDGAGLLRRCMSAPAGLEPLRDHAVVDHDRARVELIDAAPGDDARDVTVKRFPTWGDAADLIAVLERGAVVGDHRRPVVEGSQLLGQAIVAAMRQAPGRRVVSGHMVFVRAADANRPVEIDLETVTNGKTFSTFAAHAEQSGRVCATGTLTLGVPATDVAHHSEPALGVSGPYEAVPYDMGVTGRDLRVVDGAYTGDPDAPIGPPRIDAWVRFRHVPDDPAIHAGLLAQFTGHISIAAALRPHAGVGQRQAHHTLSTAINAITISFHADVRVDRWVVYRHLATVIADGMAHSECRVHDEAGTLLASFTVDAMIRPMQREGADPRRAL
jgi:acyl-CoA thioesterase